MILALLWLHLEVGGEDVPPLGNQPPKVVPIAFDGHIKATRVNILRRVYKLDATPHRRDFGVLEPNPESGGLAFAPRWQAARVFWPHVILLRLGVHFV